MDTLFFVGIMMVCIMLPVGKVLADDPTGNAEQGESVYRTYCLNGHGAKGWGDGPVAVSLRPRPADLSVKTVQKKTGERIVHHYSRLKIRNLQALQEGRVIRTAHTGFPGISTKFLELIPTGRRATQRTAREQVVANYLVRTGHECLTDFPSFEGLVAELSAPSGRVAFEFLLHGLLLQPMEP